MTRAGSVRSTAPRHLGLRLIIVISQRLPIDDLPNTNTTVGRALAWRTNVLLLAQAVLFILLIWGVDRALTASRQRQPAYSSQTTAEAVDIGPIPDCATNIYLRQDRACYTIAYAPKVGPGGVGKAWPRAWACKIGE